MDVTCSRKESTSRIRQCRLARATCRIYANDSRSLTRTTVKAGLRFAGRHTGRSASGSQRMVARSGRSQFKKSVKVGPPLRHPSLFSRSSLYCYFLTLTLFKEGLVTVS